MRKLSKKQEKHLLKRIEEYRKEHNGDTPYCFEDLLNLEEIEKLNNNELFWQNVNRFIWDYVSDINKNKNLSYQNYSMN